MLTYNNTLTSCTHRWTKSTTHSHTDIHPSQHKISFLVKEEADIIRVFSLWNPGHRWFRNCIFHPWVMHLSRWVVAFFFPLLSSPPTPGKERIEKEVILWSDSQRVALIRSAVEQTVFTDSDREGVCYRVYTVRSWEFSVLHVIFTFAFVPLIKVFVCAYLCCMLYKVYMLRSSVLLCLAAQAPIGFLFLCPPTPWLLPYIRVNNSGHAETEKPPQRLLIWTGVKKHIFPPLFPPFLFQSLYLNLQKKC